MQCTFSACYDRYRKSACVSLRCVLECRMEQQFNNLVEDSTVGTEAIDGQNVELLYRL